MELRHLRYFAAVATEEHMRRAAEKLHIAQPALTRQIADLESELGTKLFDRMPRGLRLNAAGKALLVEVRHILSKVDSAVLHAQRAAKGEVGSLRIGFIESACWLGAFPQAVQAYRTTAPQVSLELVPMFSRLQIAAIQAGEMDGGFCYAFEDFPSDSASLRLRYDRVLLAVPSHYRWRNRQDVRLTDLKEEPFIGIQRTSGPHYIDTLMRIVLSKGLSPRIVQEVVDETTMLSLVSAGMGLGFVNSANEGRKPKFVDFVPLKNFEMKLPLYFAWNKRNSTPALRQFRSIVERFVDN